jgi:hypothetical protein
MGDQKITPMTAIGKVEDPQRKRRGVLEDPFFKPRVQETQRKINETDK